MATSSSTVDDLEERRNAELEFIASAYTDEEAWSETSNGNPRVYRRVRLDQVAVVVYFELPGRYPEFEPLRVSAQVEDRSQTTSTVKKVWNALPELTRSCRNVADCHLGEESIFVIFNHLDEWIESEWPRHAWEEDEVGKEQEMPKSLPSTLILGRRLIYSHHIISKVKRASIKQLASSYQLSGYMKIGWPGLIIIEGREDDCVRFYDEIRPMSWQYLVVRGEQQQVIREGKSIEEARKFSSFEEVDDMSLVAQHCRQVGLEALFRTSMKVYDNTENASEKGEEDSHGELTGALVCVDHMNDGKNYRKWLRRTSQELDCLLLIQQCYANDDFSKRPLILVVIIGENVPAFLKRWRTGRVDVDSRGRPCLERQMTVLIEKTIEQTNLSRVDWEKQSDDCHLNVSMDYLLSLLDKVGGTEWRDAIPNQRSACTASSES